MKPKTSLEIGMRSLGDYTPADWRLEAEKGIISALADQKDKILKWLEDYDNDDYEVPRCLLKEIKELM